VRAAGVAIIILFAAALSLLATLPATDVVAQSSRSARQPYESFSAWSVDPRRLPELAVPRFLGPIGTLDDRDYWGRALETDGFPYILSIYFGLPALILAVAGALEPGRRALAALAVAALALALGQHLPGFRVIYELPLVSIFRFPVKAIAAAVLPISLLAGYGVESFRDRRRVALGAAAVAAVIAAALLTSDRFGAALSDAFAFQTLSRAALGWSFVHAAVAALALALAVRAGEDRRRALIAAVVALDLAIAGAGVNVYAPRAIYDEPPIAAEVRRLVGSGRFYAAKRDINLTAPTNEIFWLARWQIATLAGYTAAMFRIPVVYHLDYDGLAPRRMAAISEEIDRMPWERRLPLLDRAGVRAFATTDVVALPGVSEVAVLRGPSPQIRLYAYPAAQPARFRGTCGAAPVSLVRRSLNAAAYQVSAPCAGAVVFAENWYRGWTAAVDGKPAPILPADFAFSAVAVGEGTHRIERRYFPPRLIAGACGSALALVLLLALDRLWWRRLLDGELQ